MIITRKHLSRRTVLRGLGAAISLPFLDAMTPAMAGAKAAAPATKTHLLAYLPGTLDPAAPEARRANLRVGWAKPHADVLQLEDYEWVTR